MPDDKKRPQVGIGVIIRRNDTVLMLKRTGSHGEGTWSLPGGHLEFGEELADCAIREVYEETGLRVVNARFAALTNDVFADENKHYITIFVLADYDGSEPVRREPDRSTALGWFSWDKLPSPLFLPLVNLLKQEYNPFHER